MGVSPTLTPNWRNFVEGGTFLPNLPLLRHIRAEVQQNENIIDFANGELGCNLYPHDQLQNDFTGTTVNTFIKLRSSAAISRLDKR